MPGAEKAKQAPASHWKVYFLINMASNMAAGEVALGIDIGTTSIKVTLVDLLQRRSLATSKLNHSQESCVKVDSTSCFEQNPAIILKVVDECVALCLRNVDFVIVSRISSVKISGQMHGIVLWSGLNSSQPKDLRAKHVLNFGHVGNNLVFQSNLITWEDKRCDSDFLSSIPVSKSPLHSGYGCATLFWLNEHKADLVKSSHFAGSIMDLLVWFICGLELPVMSDQIAHSWGYYHHDCVSWQKDIVESRCFPVRLLPKICMAGKTVGGLAGSWHGIPAGTKVKVAMGDFQCAVMSSLDDEQTAIINLGTSSQLAVLVPRNASVEGIKKRYPALQFFPYFNGCLLAVAASLNGGNVLDAFVTALKSWIKDVGLPDVDSSTIHQKFKEICKEDREFSECNLTVIPTLFGERHCPNVSASVQNIQCGNISLRTIVEQIQVGIVRNLFEMMPVECLKYYGACRITCTGSLFEDNSFLWRAVESISGFPCVVKENADSVFGAALAE